MNIALRIVAFGSGAVVMILELAGSRIVAPYLGTSTIVWTTLIGVMLAALSLGYWLGGKAADHFPKPFALIIILLGSAAAVALIAHAQRFLGIGNNSSFLAIKAIVMMSVLFAPATILLGMVTPFAVKLSLVTLERTGRTVGNLYAISNLGSIVGTFLGGYILISFFGSSRIMSILSVILLALAGLLIAVSRGKFKSTPFVFILLIAASGLIFPGTITLGNNKRVIADVETTYGRNWVFETMDSQSKKPIRVLSNLVRGYQSAIFIHDPETLVFDYTKFFDTFELFNPGALSGLMIGGSTYTYPQHFLTTSPNRSITVIEIDPGVTQIAKKYFGLIDQPNLTIVHEDGRLYLNENKKLYDVIFIDAFRSGFTIPYHLTTVEAVEKIHGSLSQRGIVMLNMITALRGPKSAFLRAEYSTYAEKFPFVEVYRVNPEYDENEIQNIMLIASKEPLNPKGDNASIANLLEKKQPPGTPSLIALTDDFAPVERYLSGL